MVIKKEAQKITLGFSVCLLYLISHYNQVSGKYYFFFQQILSVKITDLYELVVLYPVILYAGCTEGTREAEGTISQESCYCLSFTLELFFTSLQ